jgi:hypothetical protein
MLERELNSDIKEFNAVIDFVCDQLRKDATGLWEKTQKQSVS